MKIYRNSLARYLEPAWTTLINICVAFAIYAIARLAFLLENWHYFANDLSFRQLSTLFYGGYIFDRSAIVYTNALYIVLMLFPLWLKERRGYHLFCKWLFVIVNGLALVINLCDAVYFPFTLRRTTTNVFSEFSHESNLADIFLTQTLNHWYLLLLAIVVIGLTCRLYRKPHLSHEQFSSTRHRVRFAVSQIVILALIAPLCIGACRGGLSSGIRPITINNANQYVQHPTECALVLNTPFSLIRTIGKNVFDIPNYYASLSSAERVFSPIHQPKPTHAFKRKNVVILIVESFGREYIGAFNHWLENGQYKGYTPHVDSLIGKSMVFKHSFCNGRKSIDGMPSVLCGIPMFKEPFVLTSASMNDYTGIAGLLRAEGYSTAFFHGANRGSMGFLALANKIGFEHYYGRQDYAQDPRFGGDADFDGHWGIWDEPFLQYWATKIGEMRQPFMTACFTVSSHTPFVIPDKYKAVYPEGKLPIHKCIRYTDMAIGRFFDTASKQPWYKNTIFVILSDHTNQSDHAEYQTDIGGFSSPFILFDPSGEIKPGMRDGIAQQIDVLPTVLSALGYDKPFLSFGCDLLTTPTNQTYAVNYLNGIYQYCKYGYVLQFDGQRTRAIYALDDRLMQHNLIGKIGQQAQMERELKAIIYQYMYRMANDKLQPLGHQANSTHKPQP